MLHRLHLMEPREALPSNWANSHKNRQKVGAIIGCSPLVAAQRSDLTSQVNTKWTAINVINEWRLTASDDVAGRRVVVDLPPCGGLVHHRTGLFVGLWRTRNVEEAGKFCRCIDGSSIISAGRQENDGPHATNDANFAT